ncbi:MAG TPA: SusC/RagA family TonB-linked outer membrane protein [Longimicrobiales bacterium]
MRKRRLCCWLGIALLTALAPAELAAQGRSVTGRIVDAGTQQPVPNASITVAGAPAAATALTDAEGRFTLTVPAGEVRLQVQALGYIGMEIVVGGGQSRVDIELQADVFRLEELVVTGQATTVDRRSATTSIAYVSGEDVGRVSSPTVLNAMVGKVAGVQLQTNSGAPGGGIQMQIRGTNTILGGFDPLFVVDGVIYSNVSIPGGRGYANDAANPTMEADAVNRIADLNPADIASIEVLKGAAASSIYGSKAANGVVVIQTVRGRAGAPQFNVTQRIGMSTPLRLMESRRWTREEAIAAYGDTVASFFKNDPSPYHDNAAMVYDQRNVSYETLIDVRGGTESTRYYASGTVSNEEGIERNTGAGRQSLRVNLDQSFGSDVDVSISSAYNRSVNDRGWNNNCNNFGCHGYALAYLPSFYDISAQNPDGTYVDPRQYFIVRSNPLQLTELGVNHEETNRFTGGIRLGWNVLGSDAQSLRLVAGGGVDVFEQANEVWSPNELYFEQGETFPGEAIISGGRSLFHNWNANAIHNWDGGSWSAMTSVGLQFEDRRLETSRIRTRDLLPGQRNVDRGTQTTVDEALEQERTLALYASEALRLFDARLLLQTGFRAERSSVNGDVDRYFVYPNASASYRFFDLLGEGSEVKLRVAYGETGNQPLFGQKFTTLETPQLGGRRGLAVSPTAGNPEVEPERLKEVEVGVDGIALDNRLTWQVTAFSRNTTNLLLERVPAPSTGFTSQVFNGGKIRNSGIEVALGVTPIRSADVQWISRGTFTRYTSEVVDLAGLNPFFPAGAGFGGLGQTYIEQGKPITQIVGYALVNDSTRADEISQLGNTAPDFRIGFVNDVVYKRLSLNVVLDWQQGGNVINLTQFLQDDAGTSPDYGSPEWEYRMNGYNSGSIEPYIEDATFVKLREVSLLFDVPEDITDAIGLGLRNLRLGLTGRNLFMWTRYSGLDPEVANFGSTAVRNPLDITPYPPSRNFYFNISVGF